MHTYVEKPRGTHKAMHEARSSIARPTHFRESCRVDSFLSLQRTIGNQAVLQLMQGNPSFGLIHDFTRMPVYANNTSPNKQSKLRVNRVADGTVPDKLLSKNENLQKWGTAENIPAIMHKTEYTVQASADCDQQQIDCFRRCWRRKPPWPIDKGSSGHYRYCQSKCLAEYMICIGQQVAERAFESMAAALDWLRRHPEVVVGTIVVVAGVTFIVATGGSGGLVLVPLAL